MRIRTGLWLLACCCAGLTACSAGRDAFTPYAAIGLSNNDGLAPNESNVVLAAACMTAAGYPNAQGAAPVSISLGEAGLAFSQPWGGWGYLSAAEAQQYGFQVPPGSALTALGISIQPSNPADLPLAEQTAVGKCASIVQNFTNATADGALAGIATLSNDIGNDVSRDTAVAKAVRSWSACMTRNGYSFHQPESVFFQELQNMHGAQRPINASDPVSAAAQQAQLAVAVTDATCTQSADLAGIYFAVQASYEQQLVNANQQSLTAAVRRYRTAYRTELGKLPALLRAAKATPVSTPKIARAG